ncbi:orotidine-5'-phosphate decarboxylase [Chengkuizengella marina]|uniref:Orotidine 5'-phosphate decarboxylase n=1 Tax=Chengkuizengella marina TaxID=2507566 RepID=A0A6N9Q3R7_9BACL|nr:orotidine-5'-phosphate decarboxylase [Chengkuizengella marina]NBI29448.1 orotidine-5'-phosphate decarboxylase [Chengkuizengella marina]
MGKREKIIGRTIVALDYASADEAQRLLNQLKGIPCYMKVGMQLFYAAGPSFVLKLKEQGYKVFLDLKMHDIPNTVKGGAASITRLGVDMFNVHAAGGKKMMESALEGVDQAVNPSNPKPLVIGVTQLTSTNVTTLNKEIGISGSVESSVLQYANLVKSAGLDGVVASPLEVTNIKEQNGIDFVTVTPGIRPIGSNIGDQSRVTTPKEAFNEGADYIVIGRPITASDDPRKSIESIIEELE